MMFAKNEQIKFYANYGPSAFSACREGRLSVDSGGRRVRVHSAGAVCGCRAPGARRAGIKKGPAIKKVVWNPAKR
jgi:hypothetical protein